jgi:1-acyl-sn-glycerol-3-phosphate acyltransferase
MAARKVPENDPVKRKGRSRTSPRGAAPPARRKSAPPSTPERKEPAAPIRKPSRRVAHDMPETSRSLTGAFPSVDPTGIRREPRPHPQSPSFAVDPLPHPASPDVGPEPWPHPESPSVAADPLPHPASPSVELDPTHEPPAPRRGPEPTPTAPQVQVLAAHPPTTSVLRALRGVADAAGLLLRRSERLTRLDVWGKDTELTSALRPLADVLYERYWRVETSGIENVPTGASVLVANHAGALPIDGPVLHLALRRERPDLSEARWLLEEQPFSTPFLGHLFNRLGAVLASPENAARLLADGRPLIVFPEGTHGQTKPFAQRYRLGRFGRGGYLKVALRARVPVVPVAIVGSGESTPLLAKVPMKALGVELSVPTPPLPAKWHIRFGTPFDLAGAPEDPEADPLWIDGKNLEIRDRVEQLLAELLGARPASA